ncbi:hypothetical protein [Novosphingobium sp.]|uniref:hypothetical protein n=1 Tax=Novosphingobium sp. TaxID=1874826 RepID=UPI003D1436E6
MKSHWMIAATALTMAPAGVASAQAPTPVNCRTDPAFTQMDFAVGHWDVTAKGAKDAEVRIEKILDDCAIAETWKAVAPKGDGRGLFVYSAAQQSWSYLWAANTPSTTGFKGSLTKPGEILFSTVKPLPGGVMRLRHWTLNLLPDGRIRELSVGSNDDGKTWTTEYELFWTKKA